MSADYNANRWDRDAASWERYKEYLRQPISDYMRAKIRLLAQCLADRWPQFLKMSELD